MDEGPTAEEEAAPSSDVPEPLDFSEPSPEQDLLDLKEALANGLGPASFAEKFAKIQEALGRVVPQSPMDGLATRTLSQGRSPVRRAF